MIVQTKIQELFFMSQEILKDLLVICTKEAPFRSPEGKLYCQKEGVAMGSPLGPTFANFYMGNLESNLFNDKPFIQPPIYVRYVDDIFMLVHNEQDIVMLKNEFEQSSVLNFTYEINRENQLPFLGISINNSDNSFNTKVYRKPTNEGKCLNANSECVKRYKNSVITSYLNRAFKVCMNWDEFHKEVVHIKQILVNNNFSDIEIDTHIKNFIDRKFNNCQEQQQKIEYTPLYYKNQMHANYQTEERIIKELIYNNTDKTDNGKKLKLIIYYKNMKTSNFVMRNNLQPPPKVIQQTNVVYSFKCPILQCQAKQPTETYIGMTQTSVSRRLTMHLQSGSILQHFLNSHNRKPTRSELTENTSIIAKADNRYILAVKEALLILHHDPSINRQFETFSHTLKLQPHVSNNSSTNATAIVPPMATEEPTQNEVPPQQEPVTVPHITEDNNDSNLPTVHPISPAIRQRIGNLLRSARENRDRDQDANLRPSTSPMHLRSHTRLLRNTNTQ